jgi:hypothetical protein
MTETYRDKLLRGVVTKWTAWYRILRLSHGPKWPLVLEYIKLKKWIKSPKLQPGRPGKREKKGKFLLLRKLLEEIANTTTYAKPSQDVNGFVKIISTLWIVFSETRSMLKQMRQFAEQTHAVTN